MDKFIPLLIVIAIYFFKFYKNYKKEQEKSQKRRIPQSKSIPHSPQRQEFGYPPVPSQYGDSKPKLPKLEKAVQEKTSKSKHKLSKIDTPWYKSTTEAHSLKADKATLQQERTILSETLPKSNIKVVKLEEQSIFENDNDVMDFNLKEAVIQAAILERPYK